MNKYLVFRCGKCIWKNTKSHELIGVEMAEDIDGAADTSKYDYQMLGVVKPERTAPKNHTCWHGIIETELTE